MSVTHVGETWEERGGNVKTKGIRTYKRTFKVRTDSVQDGPLTIMLAGGIPRRGDIYATAGEVDTGARCTSVSPDQDSASPKFWKVTCEYTTNWKQEEAEENPLLRPAVVSYNFVPYSKPVWKDQSNAAIVTTAGEPFDPPPEMDDARLVLTIKKNLATYDAAIAFAYANAVNNATWFNGAARTWKCAGIPGESSIENDIPFWAVTYEFHYRPETWDFQPLNQGFYYKDGTDRVLIKDKNGETLTSPALLDNAGAVLAIGGTPIFLNYRLYSPQDFSALGLP